MARRTELEVARDRELLAQIALTNPGATSQQLADIFEMKTGMEIPARTIRYDLDQLKKEMVKNASKDMVVLREMELARVDMLESEAWQAWRASMEPISKLVVEKLNRAIGVAKQAELAGQLAGELADMNEYVNEEVLETIIIEAIKQSLDDGETSETFVNKVIETTQTSVGDPRFLAQIHEIQKERRKIQGVYAPELHDIRMAKIEVKGYKGGWSPDDWPSADDDIVDGETVEEDVGYIGDGLEEDDVE